MPNRTMPHCWVPRGKRVLVRLKDGSMFIDKFRLNEKGWLYFDTCKVAVRDLQMMTIYRPQVGRDNSLHLMLAQVESQVELTAKDKIRLAQQFKSGKKELVLHK